MKHWRGRLFLNHQVVFLSDFNLLVDQIAVVFSSVNDRQMNLTPLVYFAGGVLLRANIVPTYHGFVTELGVLGCYLFAGSIILGF